MTLMPPIGASLPGACRGSRRSSRRPARARDLAGESLPSSASARRRGSVDAFVHGLAEFAGRARGRARPDPGRCAPSSRPTGAQARCRPCRSSRRVPSRRRNVAPALSSPPKPSEPSNSPSTNHLNPTGTSTELASQPRGHAVDHAAADDRLADRRRRRPARPVLEQIVDRDGQIVIRRHQAGARRDDAVAIVVGVAGEGDVEAVLHADQALHRVRRRADPSGSCRPSPGS